MEAIQIILALTIYLMVPLTGLLFFLRIRKQMKIEEIQNAPTRELFLIFATYGGLLLLTLTCLAWPLAWSGMASIGTFYLILVAPIVMGIAAYRHRKNRTFSKYHKWTVVFGLLYFAIAPATLFLLIKFTDNVVND